MTAPRADGGLADHTARLRQDFDRAFAEPVARGGTPGDDFLAIRLRGDAHALRLADVARLLRLRQLTRYAAGAPGWLGLHGVAGGVVPVYDLGVLLGRAPGDATPGWMAVCAGAPVALAFDAFDGQFRHADEPGQDLLRLPGGVRPVIPVARLLESIRSLCAQET